jgi:aflatoxin B1 aldehyde reductase
LSVFKRHNVRELNTAHDYNDGSQRKLLGSVAAGGDFAVSTKAPSFGSRVPADPKILTSRNASLKALQQDKMDIFYFYGDTTGRTVQGCQVAARGGQVQEVGRGWGAEDTRHLQAGGYVLPVAYQGGFNPISRTAEEFIFPLYDVYIVRIIPSAHLVMLLLKPIEELRHISKRALIDAMTVFKDIYFNEKSPKQSSDLTKVCRKHGVQSWKPPCDGSCIMHR